MSETENKQPQPDNSSNIRVALVCFGIVAGMVGMAYASVPLYRIFCQVTGFGGTTQVATGPAPKIIDRVINIEFDGNVNRELPWRFKPVQHRITLKVGEQALALYHATNTSNKTITGTAVFNVTPPLAGKYFNKVQCFCFTEQTLKPGQSVDMPVTFYVDPDIENDIDLKKLKTITLSYTFYKADEDETETSGGSQQKSSAAKKPLVN